MLKVKTLVAAISLAMPFMAHAAEDIKLTNSKASNKAAQQVNSSESQDTLASKTTTPPPPSLVLKTMPMGNNQASWRFGIWRSWDSGRRWHNGIDISRHSDLRLKYPDNGVVNAIGGSTGMIRVKRDNLPDNYLFMHMNQLPNAKVGTRVRANQYASVMGNKATGAVHLHFEYYVPCESGRVRFVGVTGTRTGDYATFDSKMRKMSQHGAIYKGSNQAPPKYCVTDPAPYLPQDRVFNSTMQDATLNKYLGNSIRSQYNALYNPNPKIQLGAGAVAATKQLPNLPVFTDTLTPEQLAALRAGGLNGAMFGEGAGYDLSGQLMSYQMMSSFISATDGADWTSLPQPAQAADISEMTPKEIVAQIGSKRLGNPEWETAVVKLSSKGLLTEYLMMRVEGNFLEQQNSRMKNRIEMLIAGLTQAQLFEYNKKIEAMNVMAKAEAVPQMLDIELRGDSGYGYGGYGTGNYSNFTPPASWASVDKDDLNALFDYLLMAVTHGESKSYDAFNYGTIGYTKSCAGFSTTRQARAEDDKHGRSYVSESTLGYIKSNAKPERSGCIPKRFAVGIFQFIPVTYTEYMQYIGYSKAQGVVFNSNQQIHAGRWRMLKSRRPKLSGFITGRNHNLYGAATDLYQEWRSIGKPIQGVSPDKWVATDGVNKANAESNRMVLQALIGIGEWHKKYGHLGKVEIDPNNLTLITPRPMQGVLKPDADMTKVKVSAEDKKEDKK